MQAPLRIHYSVTTKFKRNNKLFFLVLSKFSHLTVLPINFPKGKILALLFDCVFLLLPNVMEHRSLLVVCFTFTKSPRGPPWNEGHRPKVCHETSVLEVPAQEQHEHSFYSSSTNTFITCSLYTVHRYRTSLGAPDLRARSG